MIIESINKVKGQVQLNRDTSEELDKGIEQEDSLNPLLFNIVIDKIPKNINDRTKNILIDLATCQKSDGRTIVC